MHLLQILTRGTEIWRLGCEFAEAVDGVPIFPTAKCRDLYGPHKKDRTRPSFDEILMTLHSVTSAYSQVFIVINALEECEDLSRNRLLAEIYTFQNRINANIMATSRIIGNIKSHFVRCKSQEIYANDDDIRKYVATQIEHLDNDSLDDNMQARIQKKSDRSRWGNVCYHCRWRSR